MMTSASLVVMCPFRGPLSSAAIPLAADEWTAYLMAVVGAPVSMGFVDSG